MHTSTVGSYGGLVSHERGTPVLRGQQWASADRVDTTLAGYLAHKKHPARQDQYRSLGVGFL